MFPISLNLRDKLAVVVGGGAVGLRKMFAVLESGARVRLVDPRALTLPPEVDIGFPPGVTHVMEAYRAEHLDGATLAFAGAEPSVNTQVVADCRERGVWVNSASAPDEGDFAMPAVVRRGEFTLAIGTGGASPSLARRVREKLEAEYDAAFAEWVRVLAQIRAEMKLTEFGEPLRRARLDSFAGWEWLARLRAEGADAVLKAMREAASGG